MQKTLVNSKLIILWHFLGWLLILTLPRFIMQDYSRPQHHFIDHFYVEAFFYIVLFYLNYLVLVPQFFLRDKKWMYIVFVAVAITVVILVLKYFNDVVFFDAEREHKIDEIMKQVNDGHENVKPPMKQFRLIGYFYTSLLIMGFSLGLAVMQNFNESERKRKELEKEKLNSELAFLKNQVSPHFFFNTLNNIYALIGFDTEEAKDSVLKLSKLMRYLLYESESGKTKLTDEIAFMKNYIDLMKLRLNDKVKLSIAFPETVKDVAIPPLLFIPFIENAFKHGVSYREESFITGSLTCNDQYLSFKLVNSKKKGNAEKDIHSGIGLNNVKKRLALLYPKTHELTITESEKEFVVALNIVITG